MTEDEDRAGDQRGAGKIPRITANGDQAAAHGAANLIAGFAMNEDDAAAHADSAAAIAGAD